MMRWARTAVEVVEPEEADADAGALALLAASSWRRWPTPSAGSTEMPIMKPPPSASAPPPTLNMALSLPGPMAPRKRKFGVGLAAASRAVVRYMAAAVFSGRATVGRRKTTMWEKGFVVGRA